MTTRSLFDGRTLSGWRAVPRLSTPLWPGGPHPDGQPDVELAKLTAGSWHVVDGMIVGGQERHGYGGYLLTDEEFGDFELTFEVLPDWPADTGVVMRCTGRGSQGYQVLIDHRKSGSIGGFYGNGIGAFHASAFNLDVETDESGAATGLRLETPETTLEPINPAAVAQLAYHLDPQEFLRIWRFGEWNEFRVRCVGRLPRLTSWINGVKAYDRHRDDVLPALERRGRAGSARREGSHCAGGPRQRVARNGGGPVGARCSDAVAQPPCRGAVGQGFGREDRRWLRWAMAG